MAHCCFGLWVWPPLVIGLAACTPASDQAQRNQAAEITEVEYHVKTGAEGSVKLLNPDPDPATPGDSTEIKCSPLEVGPGHVLEVQFFREHAGNAAIVTPKGEWHYITSSNDAGPWLSPVYLKSSMVARIPISEIVIAPSPEDDAAPAFAEDGTYRLIVGPEIETEFENMLTDAYCHFNFRRSNRIEKKPFDYRKNGWILPQ